MYCFITLLHLISSALHTRSLLIPYGYVYIKSIDCILLSPLSPFELKAILLISSVKTVCFSLLNLCCVFNISLLFFIFMIFFKTIYLLSNFYNLKFRFSFYDTIFCAFCFFYLHRCCFLNSYMFILLIQLILLLIFLL